MKKMVIFGAGLLGRALYSTIKDTNCVLFFCDNNYTNISGLGIPVCSPQILTKSEFDVVYIASDLGVDSIYQQLTNELGVPPQKINRIFSDYWKNPLLPIGKEKIGLISRVKFLEAFALYTYTHCIDGSVAEVGVFRGDFAKEINRVFPDRKFYLFDTFCGFDKRDLETDAMKNFAFDTNAEWFAKVNYFKDSGMEIVRSKLPNPEQCEFKKGYFPESFDLDISVGERFAFVNLDADLYAPIKAGLEIFYPRMTHGGVILVHDYYGTLGGVAKAVEEFIAGNSLTAIPIGDYSSIAITKN
jgi:O-methyltransferase